jgi:hypothetical protein
MDLPETIFHEPTEKIANEIDDASLYQFFVSAQMNNLYLGLCRYNVIPHV